jgi:hypothetical protein
MNQDLKKLHDALLAQHNGLYKRLDSAPDEAMMESILSEMRELRHRIDIAQGLLFRQSTAALKTSLEKVADADAALSEALESAETAADVLKGVGKFLAVVDKALDLAKTLAPMAL